MKHDQSATGKRKPVKPRLDIRIAAAVRDAGLNPSQISKTALRAAAKKVLPSQRQEENRAAIEAHNRWVEENGIPLARYRRF